MLYISKKISQITTRFLVRCTTKKLRSRIYSIAFIGHYLQSALKRILCTILNTGDFQWFKFKSGYRAGLEMRLKLPEESEFYLETHDSGVTTLLCRCIKPGFTLIDVGAHIGYFTLLISRLVGQSGKVFALEPLPINARRLEEHLLRNNCHNTEVLQVALAEYDAKEEFLEFGFATIGRFSSAESFVRDRPCGRMTVECRSLDSLLKEHRIDLPDFVKIDVEGAELRVLKGMENLLKASNPKLLIEMHNEKTAEDYFKFLENKGYSAYYLNGKTLKKTPLYWIAELGESILFVR